MQRVTPEDVEQAYEAVAGLSCRRYAAEARKYCADALEFSSNFGHRPDYPKFSELVLTLKFVTIQMFELLDDDCDSLSNWLSVFSLERLALITVLRESTVTGNDGIVSPCAVYRRMVEEARLRRESFERHRGQMVSQFSSVLSPFEREMFIRWMYRMGWQSSLDASLDSLVWGTPLSAEDHHSMPICTPDVARYIKATEVQHCYQG